MTTSVIEYLFGTYGSDFETAIGYFMSDFSSQESLEVQTIISCIIKQILNKHHPLPGNIAKRLGSDNHLHCISPIKEVFQLLDEVLHLHKTVFLLFDGIDEMPERERFQLLEDLDELVESSTQRLKILITSRQSHVVARVPRAATELSLSDSFCIGSTGLLVDIRLYVQQQVRELIQKRRLVLKDSALQKEIEDTLVEKSDGM